MYVEADIDPPHTWNVKFQHLPYHHVDVLWDGHHPGPEPPASYSTGL